MAVPERRNVRPEDLYRIVVPSDVRLSPDATYATFTVQRVRPTFDGYASSIWIAAANGSATPRPITLGVRRDSHARWAPDGRHLAFLSDRRPILEEEPEAPPDREDSVQIHLLPMTESGEARRLTDLPRGVEAFAWSPDGRWIAALSASMGADRAADARARRKAPDARPGSPPPSDYRFADRLHFQENGRGFTEHRHRQVWLVDVSTGSARRLTHLAAGVNHLAWSPDGTRLALETGRAREADLFFRPRVVVLAVDGGRQVSVAEHPRGVFGAPAWLPDGRSIAVIGGLLPRQPYRSEIWVFPSDGSDPRGGRDLSSRHDIMPGSSVSSDVTIGEPTRLQPAADGGSILFLAPHRGSNELFRIATEDGALERLTDDQHYLSSFDAVGSRVTAIRSTAVGLPDVVTIDVAANRAPRRGARRDANRDAKPYASLESITNLNAALLDEVALRAPVERWAKVDGHDVQGWLIPAGDGARPTILEIHGGPHTLYGWSPSWEFQVLAGAGMSVAYANPRGSEGYGRAFNAANIDDWGDGPMRDVLGVVDGLVADGMADPDRLGVTGGSYGGYLTSWIVGHDQRFRAALTARSVNDLAILFLTGDLGGTEWPSQEFGAWTWEDPERFRLASPLTYADAVRTPLLIQHSEQDFRTPVNQGEAFFNRLRRLRRPVRLMRVPEENHELTRSGTPFRRVENIVQVRDWFDHFLVGGSRRLPPVPRTRHGR